MNEKPKAVSSDLSLHGDETCLTFSEINDLDIINKQLSFFWQR